MQPERRLPAARPIGLTLLVAFFGFGAIACVVTVLALLFSGGVLDAVWRLHPEARDGFQRIGTLWSVLLMGVVGTACATAALGLAWNKAWGRRLAIGILVVNLIGDSVNAAVRGDARTLIGLPIGGFMIFYLWWKGRAASR